VWVHELFFGGNFPVGIVEGMTFGTMHTAPTLDPAACNLEDLAAILETGSPTDYAFASEIVDQVVVYQADSLRSMLGKSETLARVRSELEQVLLHGPGVFVIRNAFEAEVVDRATAEFSAIIEEEKRRNGPTGDHFAAAGANDRVWNALEKFAIAAPEVFNDYYANDMLALGALAWLGPAYQVSSQVNVVKPGGQAQAPHRDYHLGFMTNEQAARYPAVAHRLSPVLTLQGAVAHVDMPLESGPTMLLPHSQKYELGYLAWRHPEFIDFFAERHTQTALAKGDLVYFNPAVLHGAGTNVTADVNRMANLLQISSAMGQMMEVVDRDRMVTTLYPDWLTRVGDPVRREGLDHAIAAAADGYAFATNLDRDQPIDGLTPPSQADLIYQALNEAWTTDRFAAALEEFRHRRLTH